MSTTPVQKKRRYSEPGASGDMEVQAYVDSADQESYEECRSPSPLGHADLGLSSSKSTSSTSSDKSTGSKSSGNNSAQSDPFLHRGAKRVLVKQMRYQQEKHNRKMQKDARDNKKKKTLERAARPRNKQNGFQKPQRKGKARIKFVRQPIEELHQELVDSLDEPLLQVYLHNYQYWLMKKQEALIYAEQLDEEAEAQYESQKREREAKAHSQQHRNMFQAALCDIATVVPHTNYTSNKFKKNGRIDMFFKPVTGVYKSKVEKEFDEFYVEEVSTSLVEITRWPEVIQSNPTEEADKNMKMKRRNIQQSFCTECEVDALIVDSQMGCYVCTNCGTSTLGDDGVQYQPTFDQIQSTTRGAAPYDRLAHVSIYYLFIEGNYGLSPN